MKKLSLGFVAVLMFLLVFGVTCFAEERTLSPEGNVYYIHSSADLEWVARQTHSGNDFKGYEVRLDDDIVCLKRTFTTEIGTETTPFNGYFNGQGNLLQFNDVCTDYGTIFGCIGKDGHVDNLRTGRMLRTGLGMKRCYFTSVSGPNGCAAGLAYQNDGTISNCRICSDIGNSTTNSAAGVAINNSGEIRNCEVYGKVIGTQNIGGIAVENSGTIKDCTFNPCINPVSYAEGAFSKAKISACVAVHNSSTGNITNCQVRRICYRKSTAGYVHKNEGNLDKCGKFICEKFEAGLGMF